MEIVYVILGIIVVAIVLAIIAIRGSKKPKRNARCMNCDMATPDDKGICPYCHYNERTQKLEN